MPNELIFEYTVYTDKSVLSSECGIKKTEAFIKETRRFADADLFLSKLAEGLILCFDKSDFRKTAEASPKNSVDCYRIDVADGAFVFYFRFGCAVDSVRHLSPLDIVFFKYVDQENSGRRNDQSFAAFMRTNKTFTAKLFADKYLTSSVDFKKLYHLSCADQINFPLLSAEQSAIVETEDKNVLVQGVAGSGKTNICINKIVFTACRGYTGRTLYTTFSRGLLLDTRAKAEAFNMNLKAFVRDYSEGRVVFADKNHKKAIETKFAMSFPAREDEKIVSKIRSISDYLDNKVDYFLIEDLYNRYAGKAEAVDESYFIKKYAKNIKNHQLVGKLSRISYLSHEVVFKEIYGMILGCCNPENPQRMLTADEYAAKRQDSFSRPECDIIYALARDYAAHLASAGLSDNNVMSRRLLSKISAVEPYSLAVIDEVQDMTEVSLCLMKGIARKLFCVGDALQMINPSFFSFAYLKNLLFEKDVVSVAELTNNYRNTRRIAEIVDGLGGLNVGRFGTHSFVLKGESVDSEAETSAVYVHDAGFLQAVASQNFDNFTVIVAGNREKEELRKLLKRQEILTVSEIKGLERETVILCNVLSDNADKWAALERMSLNRKRADENSVYRYYFNLFYVAVSRAKQNLYVYENKTIPMFEPFFRERFERLSSAEAVTKLTEVIRLIDTDREELLERVGQFIKLGQYDNARFAANKIADDLERTRLLEDTDIFEQYIQHGKYREAGIRYWELGRPDEAKKQFELSGDSTLSDLVDACSGSGEKGLAADIVRYYPEVAGNESAKRLIVETLEHDLKRFAERQKAITNTLKNSKERKHG